MLTFILGPSGSGKSRRMLAELRARAENGQRSLLIVPEQFTSSTEGTLYHILGDSLSAYVESYSFTSLAESLLRRYGGAAVETLSEAGRALLVRRAADSLLDKVVYYNRQRRSAAFCEKAAQTIEELKSAGITPDQLAAYARLPGADREKLEELSLIYGSYEAQLAQTAMDPGDRQQLAAQMLDASFFAGRAVYMDEFDTFNAPKRALLAAMLPVADVTVCLCCDGEQDTAGGMGLFSGVQRVIAGLKRMAADANVPTRTVVLTEDKRHAGVPALAELNLLLAARPRPRPWPPPSPSVPAPECPTAAWRSSAATPLGILAHYGTNSACRASRCFATKPPRRRTPPPPAPCMPRWTWPAAVSPAAVCCVCSRPASSTCRNSSSVHWKTMLTPGRCAPPIGVSPSPAALPGTRAPIKSRTARPWRTPKPPAPL